MDWIGGEGSGGLISQKLSWTPSRISLLSPMLASPPALMIPSSPVPPWASSPIHAGLASSLAPAALDCAVAKDLVGVAFIQRGQEGDLFLTPAEWALEFMWPLLLDIAPDRLKWLIRHGTFAARLSVLKRALPSIEALINAGYCFFGDQCCCGGRKFTSASGLVGHVFTFDFMRYSATLFMQPRKLQFYSMYNFFVRLPDSAWYSWLDFYEHAMLPRMYASQSNFVLLREYTAKYLNALTGVLHQDSTGYFNAWNAPALSGYAYVQPGDLPDFPITV
jgi:hypothetical protein